MLSDSLQTFNMLLPVVLLCVLSLKVTYCSETEITFKNVTFRGYSMYTEKFTKKIRASNSLKEFLPKAVFDKIEFQDQNIPIIFEDALSNLTELDELIIENSGVYEIRPGAMKNVPLLRKLSLKGNKLEGIQDGVFTNLQLSVIDLSSNFITTIASAAFDHMPNLLHLNLADNKITKWNAKWFSDTPILNRISMQNNSLEVLPAKAFQNLKGIKMFGKLDLTVNLVFSYNKINEINPAAFHGLSRIRNLWLDHNSLDDFNENLLKNVDIDDLRIDHNNIKCLQGDYEKLFKAKSTHIDSNPFECDCLESIKAYVHSNSKEVDFFFADMECSTQRIRKKMDALEKRLKEISQMDATDAEDFDEDINVVKNTPQK